MPNEYAEDYENVRVYQKSGTVNGVAGTVSLAFDSFDIGRIERIIVRRTAGDAGNFGVEVRDDNSGTADDDNRWYYLPPAARTKSDTIPDAKEIQNRDSPTVPRFYVLVPFSGGTAVDQTYEVTVWCRRFRR
jgi:hypothetical protein